VKKLVSFFSLILLLPSLSWASGLFSLGFGSINQFQIEPFNPGLHQAQVIDVHNWATGGELRSRILGIQLDGYMLIQQGKIIDVTEQGKPVFEDDVAQRLFGMVSVGFSTEVAAFTRLSIAAGPLLGFDVNPGFHINFWAGSEDNVHNQATLSEFFANITAAYRMRLDLNLGGFTVGVHYQVPSLGFSYAHPELALLEPDWSKGKVGASFITSFF